MSYNSTMIQLSEAVYNWADILVLAYIMVLLQLSKAIIVTAWYTRPGRILVQPCPSRDLLVQCTLVQAYVMVPWHTSAVIFRLSHSILWVFYVSHPQWGGSYGLWQGRVCQGGMSRFWFGETIFKSVFLKLVYATTRHIFESKRLKSKKHLNCNLFSLYEDKKSFLFFYKT